MKNLIGLSILAQMQGLEEIGGVGSTHEYITVMEELAAEIKKRVEVARSTLPLYGVRLYKRTDKWAVWYMCPHAGHVYLDPRFDCEEDAEDFVVNELNGRVASI